MTDHNEISAAQERTSGPVEHVAQIGLIVLLIGWCFHVVRPFVEPVIWGGILAVSLYPLYARLKTALKGREIIAAALVILFSLTVLAIPMAYLGNTLVVSGENLHRHIDQDGLQIPPPPDAVSRVPLVGPTVERYWRKASTDKGALRDALKRHLTPVATRAVTVVAGLSFALAELIIAIFIAGVMLAYTRQLLASIRRVVLRVTPHKGHALVILGSATIRNVSRGVLGVALIQTICAGIGFLLAAVPAAGLWALLCFILATVQIGILPVVAPIVIYVFFTADLTIAIPFALWCGFVGLIDNVLKPLLLHHGMSTPLWVIIVGSIGGLLTSGVIGLFIGPVVLVLGYELSRSWLAEDGSG